MSKFIELTEPRGFQIAISTDIIVGVHETVAGTAIDIIMGGKDRVVIVKETYEEVMAMLEDDAPIKITTGMVLDAKEVMTERWKGETK